MKVKSDIKGRNQEVILGGSMSRAIAMLAIPTMVNSLLQTAYNLTDTYWLGHVGSEELAAINLVTPVQNIITNFGSGITVAGSVLIAQYIGGRARDKAKKMAEQIYVSAVLFAVICAALCFILTPAIVSWLGAEGNVFSHAKTYLQIVILDMPLLFTINVFTAVNQAQGDTLRPMRLNFLGTALNMVLDPLFMAVFKWGTAGAALATMLAKLPPALIALVLLMRPGDGISISFNGFRFDTGELKKILTVGLPSVMGSSAMWFGFLLMSKNVFVYGTNAMAAYGIGNKC
ncbi:MAG: MATE family efflux transporter, partial [Lachnospiraceae bacterium]|nr:MATE family efflux transporter [Lachnospiraceae bacterium]